MGRRGSTLGQARGGTFYEVATDLRVEECGVCRVVFAYPAEHYRQANADHDVWFWCPNGHKLHYLGKTQEEQQRERAERAEALASRRLAAFDQERAMTASARRSAAALRGHLTRMKNRIAAGVCPVPGCQRTGLTQTLRHIQTKHPDWLHEHPEVQ